MNRSLLFLAFATLFNLTALPGIGHAAVPALQNAELGLSPAAAYQVTSGDRADNAAPCEARWYFQNDLIAAPTKAPGYEPSQPATEDGIRHAASDVKTGAPLPLVWIGSRQRLEHVRIDGNQIRDAEGHNQPLLLTPRLASNRSWFNADSAAFYQGKNLRLRGEETPRGFVARALWPEDWRLDLNAPQRQPGKSETPRNLVRAQAGFESRVLWERQPGSPRQWSGKATLGVMLNGAQGDDDEAHGGHFALTTGRIGPNGEMADWLAHNFYNLDSVSEKGIIAAPTPLDAYLTDLNSGQQWYRPSWMMVAVLKDGQAAQLSQAALGRIYGHFYRHDFVYSHARDNCTSISVDTLRGLGWNLPERGATSQLKAVAGYLYAAADGGSLTAGRKLYDYLSAEQTRLYPGVAFEALTDDLTALAKGKAGRELTAFEQQLADDVEALILVRLPQIPSSRAWGQAPVFSFDEYRARVPADQADWEIVSVPARPFPTEFVRQEAPQPSPLPVSVAGSVLGLFGLVGWFIRRWYKRSMA